MKAICRLVVMEGDKGVPLYEAGIFGTAATFEEEIEGSMDKAEREAKQDVEIFLDTYIADDGGIISDSSQVPIATGKWYQGVLNWTYQIER